MRSSLFSLALAALLLFGGVSTAHAAGEVCDTDGSCQNGEVCLLADVDESASPEATVFGTCVAPAQTGEACADLKPCATGLTCNATSNVCEGEAAPSGFQAARQGDFGLDVLRQNTGLVQTQPQTLVVNIVRQVFLFIGALLVLLLIAGGIAYMTGASTGKKDRLDLGKQIITAAIVGTVIVFAAFLIAEFVIRALTAT